MKKGKRQMTHVVKDNALINASYNLELVEQRIVLQAIVKARETETGFDTKTPVFIHASEYEKQYNVTKDGAYKALKDAVLSLFERQFSYREINERGNTENVRSRWVSEVRYVDAEATVKLIFAPIVIPLITRLEERFTQYEMKQISELSTGYAIRLYELLICWRTTGKTPIIELADFRQKMGVLDAEYQRMYDLKKYVLEPSLKQINEHTDITASYEQHKKGRTITGFSFKFKQKKKTGTETPKNSDFSDSKQKPVEIPDEVVKQPKNANMDVLEHRKSKITGLIMSNGLADRFKRGDESVMDMMKRIKEEITTDATADQWQSKLEEFGVVF